jgi:capsid protein
MAKAHEIWCRLGVMTDAAIAEDLGHDIEDVYAQRAREKALRATYGLTDHQFQGITNPFGDATELEPDSTETSEDSIQP